MADDFTEESEGDINKRAENLGRILATAIMEFFDAKATATSRVDAPLQNAPPAPEQPVPAPQAPPPEPRPPTIQLPPSPPSMVQPLFFDESRPEPRPPIHAPHLHPRDYAGPAIPRMPEAQRAPQPERPAPEVSQAPQQPPSVVLPPLPGGPPPVADRPRTPVTPSQPPPRVEAPLPEIAQEPPAIRGESTPDDPFGIHQALRRSIEFAQAHDPTRDRLVQMVSEYIQRENQMREQMMQMIYSLRQEQERQYHRLEQLDAGYKRNRDTLHDTNI